MKPGDTAEVTPVLVVRRVRISSSQEPWQQGSGPMDSPGMTPGPLTWAPHTSREFCHALVVSLFQRLRPVAAGHKVCLSHCLRPLWPHLCQAQPLLLRLLQLFKSGGGRLQFTWRHPEAPLPVSPGKRPCWGGPCQLRGTLCPLAKLVLPLPHGWAMLPLSTEVCPDYAPDWCTPPPFLI